VSRDYKDRVSANRRARECALQVLFELDGLSAEDATAAVDEALEKFWKHLAPEMAENDATLQYAERVVRRVVKNRAGLDEAIESKLHNWKLDRMSRVDRSILRLGAYELLIARVQTRIAVTQAVELAKAFGTEESGAFVNGVLDRVATLRTQWEP
jgi:N utilization substance protein B